MVILVTRLGMGDTPPLMRLVAGLGTGSLLAGDGVGCVEYSGDYIEYNNFYVHISTLITSNI